MKKNFRRYVATGVVTLGLLAAASLPALAKDSRTVTLDHAAVLNGSSLPAGKYNIQWQTHSPEATVEFMRHHKVVATTEGRVEQREKTYDRDMVVYNTASDGSMSVVEIRFADSNKVLVFN